MVAHFPKLFSAKSSSAGFPKAACTAAVCTAILATAAVAEDKYFVESIRDLEFLEEDAPELSVFIPAFSRTNAIPYAICGDEAYVTASNPSNAFATRTPLDVRIAIRLSGDQRGEHVDGTLFWPVRSGQEMVRRRFRLKVSEVSTTKRQEFLEEKLKHYRSLLQTDRPGAAWFRHQVRETRRALDRPIANNRRGGIRGGRGASLADTFALISGGRALSENLQLDRAMPVTKAAEETVPLSSIRGITVREYEWGPHIKDVHPTTDPLAKLIPDDQHVVFFSSLGAMTSIAENVNEHGDEILNLAVVRGEDSKTRRRYEQQLGLSLAAARGLPPSAIQSGALTGGDPYFVTGTDVAILLETENPKALKQLIDLQVTVAAQGHENVRTDNGRIGKIDYRGVRTLDRKLCSYRAVLGDAVVITNSRAQLKRLVDTFESRHPSLASLPEYTFFRDRYKRDGSETGLLVISDKTIRRWCGPRWRIGSSRRARAAALMAEVQAAHLDQLVHGEVKAGPVQAANLAPAAGELVLRAPGVLSEQFGSLEFQTPIAEMEFDAATKREADLYKRWRDGYERDWSNFFDPIAVQFTLTRKNLTADVSVIPLIASSQYRTVVAVSQGAKVGVNDGDPHEGALLHLSLALNRESQATQLYVGMIGLLSPDLNLNPRAWIGDTVAVYVDDGKFFTDLMQVSSEEFPKFADANVHRLPLALHIGARSSAELKLFVKDAQEFVEKASSLATWETRDYNGQPYVRIAPTKQGRAHLGSAFGKASIYFTASDDALLLTLNESVLKRSVDRAKRRKVDADGGDWKRPGLPWIGDNLNVQVDAKLLSYFEKPLHKYYQQTMQDLCWNNLQILNEWKRRYPDSDPVELHEAFWQRRLVCPGGGRYQWNESWGTMESSVFGHPGEPQDGPAWPASLARLSKGNFGLTFEDDGLRAKIEIRRK